MDNEQLLSFERAARTSLALGPGERQDLSDCHGCATALLLNHLLRVEPQRRCVVLCADTEATQRVESDLAALCPGVSVRVLPARGESPYDQVRPERSVAMQRMAALSSLCDPVKPVQVLVACAASWLQRVPAQESVKERSVLLAQGAQLDVQALTLGLDAAGYRRTPLVEDPGTFALRGEILDVWPPTAGAPLRLELEFDRLQTIGSFDPETQRKHAETALREVTLGPAREVACADRTPEESARVVRELCDAIQLPSTKTRALIDDLLGGRLFVGESGLLPALCTLVPLTSYLTEERLLLVEDPDAVVTAALRHQEHLTQLHQNRPQDQPAFVPVAHVLDGQELDDTLRSLPHVALHPTAILGGSRAGFSSLAAAPEGCPSLSTQDLTALSTDLGLARRDGSDLSPLVTALGRWQDSGLAVTLTARTISQAERIHVLLRHREIPCQLVDLDVHRPAKGGSIDIAVAPLARGVVAEHQGLVLVTEEEIFGRRKHHPSSTKKSRVFEALDDLRHLRVGDHVVHVEHGVGRYQGLLQQIAGGITVDVLAIEYSGGDRLLLPVYRLNQIQKYSGDGTAKLDRLGGQTFLKTKSRVKKKVRDLADQLLRVYSARHQKQRPPIPAPGDDYLSFEAGFPYEETPDQAAAIADVIRDMQADTVMDRLVCGDVGFGKTEVALRAAFLAAHAGRQVALLCPTTVLADQHLQTFRDRLAQSGIEVRGLSRFESKSAVDKTLAALKSGTVDVVVGTHRVLSKDVFFKNLGLLIIDEEQRFGVGHKERMKELKSQVDVLTLTATPIPRTLNLAVGGLRDMSVILTPPEERRSIRTLVARHDEPLIAQAITRELERGGQVFYVYNRVEGLMERAARLRQLLPEVKVGVVHGQLGERELETQMHAFVQGKYDVLCATAIIESGLDIPRANTIIIDRADLFGLAQLYQLRGRVGRSTERAFCYLLVPGEDQLNHEARKRIETLERYSELGSGFQVATMDMELRGAGDILGAEQTGFSTQVGFELFAQMLAEATTELSGGQYVPEVDPELSLDVEAYLPETYVDDVGVRLSLYKRYASASDGARVVELDEELTERFGAPPPPARAFSLVMLMKAELRGLRVLALQATKALAHLHLRHDTPIHTERLVQLVAEQPGQYTLSPDGRVTRRAQAHESIMNGYDHALRMIQELTQTSRAR